MRYVTLGDGRKVSLGRYVAAWKACKALPANTPIGRGIDGWGQNAGEALVQLRRGLEDRNNSANMRRIEQRIEALKRNATRETREEDYQGVVKLVENAEANRVQLIFPGKPSAEVRTKLKKSGFRWSPSEGAWQRQLNNAAVYWAKELVKELIAEGAQ